MRFIISEAKHSELLAEFEIPNEAAKRYSFPGLLDVHASLSMYFVAVLMPSQHVHTLFLLVASTEMTSFQTLFILN